MSELSADEIVDLCLRHTLFDWQAQAQRDPIAVHRAEGEFFTVDGKRYLDFNSQLMGVNIGHGDPRVVEAIAAPGRAALPTSRPFMATEARAELGEKLAELMPGDIDKVFFTLGGAEANENAIRIAKAVTGRHKILARYRSLPRRDRPRRSR